jgi:exo-beta-1,3-glucanase (GH17 family)
MKKALLISLFLSSISNAQTCGHHEQTTPNLNRLESAMEHGRFIGYTPTGTQLINGKPTRAQPGEIRADLQVLRPRFDSLITYNAENGAEAIPAIAQQLGFKALIIGVYDPFNTAELNAAIAAAKTYPKLVVGISLGNELLFFKRHSANELQAIFTTARNQLPQTPLTTTEPFHIFEQPNPLLQEMDFLLANVHPIFQPWFKTASDADAAQFVVNVTTDLGKQYCGPILIKETGIPTAPAAKGFTEARQASFYKELQQRLKPTSQHAFAYFSAFDAAWRTRDTGPGPGQHPQEEEAHWGLYNERRQPKPVVAQINELH